MLGYKLITFGGHCSNNTFVIVSLNTNQSVQSPSPPVPDGLGQVIWRSHRELERLLLSYK